MAIDGDGGSNRMTLDIEWGGENFRCKADMKSIMMIEERVPLHRLAQRVVSDPEGIPVSHLVWCVYCLLHTAGCKATADDVRDAVRDGNLPADTMTDVVKWLLVETYGVGPQPHEDDETDEDETDEGKPAA